MKYLQAFFLVLFSNLVIAGEISTTLHSGWQFRQGNQAFWLPADIPGTVHTDLLINGKIEDPFYRTNEKDLQWIEHEDWEYKTVFSVGSDVITKDKIILDFQGLDTYADIYLNDTLILKANNMFRTWQVEVNQTIKRGENELRIFFHSPIKKTEPLYDQLGYTIPVSSNDQAEKKLSIFTRKAPYHYGWDWGPRFVTAGIWRPIVLRAWDRAIIREVIIDQKDITLKNATLLFDLKYDVTRPFMGEIEILIDGISAKTTTVDLKHGQQSGNIILSIANPELWWPNGLGVQKLYNINVLLKKEKEVVHEYDTRLGLRTIELVQDDDRHGTSFYLKVNGQAVFMKGANYIPQDNFLPRVTADKYEHLLQSAADAHMNMIRVWGGGIYENDIFYDKCDEKGLLVWQDFMFSCAMYPGDSSFLENVRLEAAEHVKRLRSHPSLALWCGNNEILMKWQNWHNNANEEGGQVPLWKNKADSMKIEQAYHDIFKSILPDAVNAHGQGVPYWESSPSAKNGNFADWKSGDAHYWGVWWGQAPFEDYRKNIGRFMSEYGFQSFPEFSTIKTFTTEKDWDIYSEVMQAHQRSSIGNGTIARYMQQHFREPRNFENYLYLSQLLQGEGVKVAMEAHRIRMPLNMGSLVWQLNDCWPVASWSGIDYYGRWKALHYYIKRSFEEVIVAFEDDENEVKAFVVSDRTDELKATLIVEVLDFEGKRISMTEKKIKVKAQDGEEVWKGAKKELLNKVKIPEVILRAQLMEDNHLLAENIYLFTTHKELKLSDPGIKFSFSEKGGRQYLEVKSNKTAFGVSIFADGVDMRLSDNFFTLVAKESKVIEIISEAPIVQIKNKLQVKSLFDSYKP
jgi:beta-mannosidase